MLMCLIHCCVVGRCHAEVFAHAVLLIDFVFFLFHSSFMFSCSHSVCAAVQCRVCVYTYERKIMHLATSV